ncbi:HLA class II histocompatibility antigen, DR alpha chain-like [Platysternon megacephalum]|uniref:HLA class II histocompatibility antigen, DR alpha chain-like n=1 Tax=Platysternon megacephalum TaxID=55544 RepID=A0A4D9DJF7_9SAUR|nr:HLA class II histocompatibility antigen, DR alpha chain-like [Platysternon megacephalum]
MSGKPGRDRRRLEPSADGLVSKAEGKFYTSVPMVEETVGFIPASTWYLAEGEKIRPPDPTAINGFVTVPPKQNIQRDKVQTVKGFIESRCNSWSEFPGSCINEHLSSAPDSTFMVGSS